MRNLSETRSSVEVSAVTIMRSAKLSSFSVKYALNAGKSCSNKPYWRNKR